MIAALPESTTSQAEIGLIETITLGEPLCRMLIDRLKWRGVHSEPGVYCQYGCYNRVAGALKRRRAEVGYQSTYRMRTLCLNGDEEL